MTPTKHGNDPLYLACHSCRRLQPLGGDAARLDDDSATAAAESRQEFESEHAGHPLAVVRRHGAAVRVDGPAWDPMSVVTFTVADDHATYVVTADRPSIEEPRIYSFVPGELACAPASVSIEHRHLLRGLDRELFPHVLRTSKLDRFLGAIRSVVERIDIEALDVAFDDADDPAVGIAPMPDTHYAELVENCARIFDPAELPRVSGFLAANRREDGLLALRVRHDYRIGA